MTRFIILCQARGSYHIFSHFDFGSDIEDVVMVSESSSGGCAVINVFSGDEDVLEL